VGTHGACEGHVGPHLASSCFAFPVILRLHEDSERQADLWCFFENRFELTFSLVRHGRTRQRSLDSDILGLRDASSIVSSEQLSRCAAVSSEDNLSALSREIESHKRLATARSRVKTSKWQRNQTIGSRTSVRSDVYRIAKSDDVFGACGTTV